MGDNHSTLRRIWERVKPRPPLPTRKDVAVALQLMAIMLEAGVPMAEAFNAVRNQTPDPVFDKILEDIEYKVTRVGWKFSQTLTQYPEVFPPYCVLFIQAGEATGDLAARLRRAGQLMERNDNLTKQIKSALTAPALTVTVACIILYLCVKFVMPKFIDMYSGMNVELPEITKIVIGVVNIGNHWAFLLSMFLLIVTIRRNWTEIQERMFTRLLHLQPFRRWIGNVLGAQFCDVLGSLIKEGVSLVKAIQMMAATAPFRAHRECLKKVHAALLEEGDFAESMLIVDYFPAMVTTVASVGQEIGALETLLSSLTRILEQEVDLTITAIVALLEPVMICGLGLLTAFFFVGLFLPVYGMLNNIGA
ncbi:type II secretion system F family protein [bacterium]|nr:type II secretion system F family protein [bacterium]